MRSAAETGRAVTTFVPSALVTGAVTLTVPDPSEAGFPFFAEHDCDVELPEESPFEPLSACEAATGTDIISATATAARGNIWRLLMKQPAFPRAQGARVLL